MGIGSQTINELKSIAYGQEEVNKSLSQEIRHTASEP